MMICQRVRRDIFSLLAVGACGACVLLAVGAAGAKDDQRTRAPADAQAEGSRTQVPSGLRCPRDRITSYAGTVIGYRRTHAQTWLRIATDWQTTEEVTVRHAGPGGAPPHFLIEGRAFTSADWPRIEQRAGRLHKDVRATAWVCDDGGSPVVDWLPPRER